MEQTPGKHTATVGVKAVDMALPVDALSLPAFDRPLSAAVREARLLTEAPSVRALGKLDMQVSTDGWRFPAPLETVPVAAPRRPAAQRSTRPPAAKTRLKPPAETVLLKDRLLYL